MSIVNVPIVNSTLANAELVEKRKQFIINDCEMLRREFEVYGIELSDAVLDLYRKALILYNANIVWDLRAVSWRMCYQQNYSNGTNKLAFNVPETFNVPIGIKSIDPLTLSFMTSDEVRSHVFGHVTSYYKYAAPDYDYSSMPVFDNKTPMMSPFSSIGYAEIEANFQSKYGAFNSSYFNSISDVPIHQRIYQSVWLEIQTMFKERSTEIVKLFQNPSLEMRSLIPVFKSLFELNTYQATGIEFKGYIDFEAIHFASMDKYFAGYRSKRNNSAWKAYGSVADMMFYRLHGYGECVLYGNSANQSYALSKKTVLGIAPTQAEIDDLRGSLAYPSTDTRTDYQKVFTYSSYSPDEVSTILNRNGDCVSARRTKLHKEFVDNHGGHPSVFQSLFWIITEAHASVMTPVNILNMDFCKYFSKCVVVMSNVRSPYGQIVKDYTEGCKGDVQEIYVMLNNNYRASMVDNNTGKTTDLNRDGVVVVNADSYRLNMTVPVDIAQPFPYYKITRPKTAQDSNTHLVKTTAFLGLQKLRNGFLYQDIARNFSATFVNFNEASISQLESLVSKQIAIYDLLSDVKAGNIYTKAITTSVPKEPFNPSMPEYTTTTRYVDVMKTPEGDMPILHPEMGYEIKWQQIHAEMVIQSSFFYHQFILAITPTINDYNNRVGSYIVKLLNEMKTLSTTYVAAEAERLKAEQEAVKLDVAIEKLKSGVFINDNGKEYWRPLLPEEKAEVDKMIARIENNVETEKKNAVVMEQNVIYQLEADKAQIEENKLIQQEADMRVIELNKQYQEQVDLQVLQANEAAQQKADAEQAARNAQVKMEDAKWKHDNVDSIVCPTLPDLYEIAKSKNTILSDALIIWENAHPYYTYNQGLAIQVNELRSKIIQVEQGTLERLVEAKTNSTKIAMALMEIFPEDTKRII